MDTLRLGLRPGVHIGWQDETAVPGGVPGRGRPTGSIRRHDLGRREDLGVSVESLREWVKRTNAARLACCRVDKVNSWARRGRSEPRPSPDSPVPPAISSRRNEEMAPCRSFAEPSLADTRQPAVFALAEATGRTSELHLVDVCTMFARSPFSQSPSGTFRGTRTPKRLVSGGGRESNPPASSRRHTGFEVWGRSCHPM